MRRWTLAFIAACFAACSAVAVVAATPPRAEPSTVISSEAIEAALRGPAPAAAPSEPVKTRGLRLQARSEESRAGGEGTSVPAAGGVDLQIAFALDSARLLPEAQRQLGELARALQSPGLAGRHFLLAGHTDASGGAEHNRQLSLARAASVREYLAGAGVDATRLSVTGYGAERPLEGRSPYDARNRRVEVRSLEDAP